jgi:hypothetical protein
MTHAPEQPAHRRPPGGGSSRGNRRLWRRNGLWVLLLGGLLATGLSFAPAASGASYSLQVSASDDRRQAYPLDGAAVAGEQFVFVAGIPSAKASVSFYVDDPLQDEDPYSIETLAPHDLAGTDPDGTAWAFDVDELGSGAHTVTAVVEEGRHTRTVHASFTVEAPVQQPGEAGVEAEAGEAETGQSDSRSGTAEGAEPAPFELLVSSSADRSSAVPLEGRAVAGRVFPFITGDSTVTRVTFWVDDPARTKPGHRIEPNAPYDVAGGIGDKARPFDTRALRDGQHTVTALIERGRAGSVVATWSFRVANASGPGSSWPPAPQPDSDPVPIPQPDPEPETDPDPDPVPPTSPPAAGFPNASNTGVPAGVTLTPYTGPSRISADGTVIDRKEITSCLSIAADNVKITRSRIRCGGPHGIRVLGGSNGVVVEDTEIDGSGGTVTAAVCCSRYVLRRVDIHGVIDGPRLGSDTVVERSWIHDLKRVPGSHNDTLQILQGTNVVVRGNTLQAYRPATGDPMNAVLMVGALAGDLRNFVFEDNYVNGGNYTIYAGNGSKHQISNFVIRRNRFGRDFRYGVLSALSPTTVWESTNVWHDTGTPVR